MNILKIIILLLVFGNFEIACQSGVSNSHKATVASFEKQYLKYWKMESSTQVKTADSAVALPAFSDDQWLKVEVPTTVLGALVKAGIYPDPHLDLNNFKIPDASDTLNEQLDLGKYSHIKGLSNPFKDPYWFRTDFKIPARKKGQKIWLNFDGINYRADIWLNGYKIADAKEVEGMFTRFKFDITPYALIGQKNILAVKIHQVDHIGTPSPGKQLTVFGPQRGWGTDIFKDATLKFSAGWDCAPVVRDRNMGIYQDVFLTYTGAVDIIDPYIVTDLPLPDTALANVSIQVELKNTTDKQIKGFLKGKISMLKEIDFYNYKKTMSGSMKPVYFEKEVTIPAKKTVTAYINHRDFPQLVLHNPHLWWPNGYGKQYLHDLELTYEIEGKPSDKEHTVFGIREINTTLNERNGEYGRVFWVNGRKIFARGGWLQPDMMLDMNKERVYNEARLLANANVNILACEDMPAPPEHLMETYDKYGLLMWETFYQCWTSYPGTPSFANPINADLAVNNAYDIIKRYRNHPSLLLWTLQCETIVREEIYTPVRQYLNKMDETRPFIPTSSYDWDVDSLTPYMKADMPIGMTDDGPPDYTWYPHEYYYNKVLEVKQQMFRDEMGVPSVPTLSSMKKFIFDLGQGQRDSIYPLDKNWAHHGAWDDGGYVYKAYDVALRKRYGSPQTAEEYIHNAQYVNAGSYRAMFEATNHRMWDITSGLMLWKLNSTWPTVVWQIYDWFLNPTSAYYFTKKALEPVHIQLNENNFTVSIINTQYKKQENLKAIIQVFDFDMNEKWKKEIIVTLDESSYKEIVKLPDFKTLIGTYFVKLTLENNKQKIISDNFYWLSPDGKNDFRDLAQLQPVKVQITSQIEQRGDNVIVNVHIKNDTDKLAFMKRFMITKGEGGMEVLPTIWSDNFISLIPGESINISATVAKKDLDGQIPLVVDSVY